MKQGKKHDEAEPLCQKCDGIGILPNRMDAPGGPECACGRPSRFASGDCGVGHGILVCDCPAGELHNTEQQLLNEMYPDDDEVIFVSDHEDAQWMNYRPR